MAAIVYKIAVASRILIGPYVFCTKMIQTGTLQTDLGAFMLQISIQFKSFIVIVSTANNETRIASPLVFGRQKSMVRHLKTSLTKTHNKNLINR